MKKYLVLLFLFVATPALAADPALQRGIDLAYNAQFGEAERVLNNYISSHPQDPLGYLMLGTTLDWKQKLTDAGNLDPTIISTYDKASYMAFLQWDKDQDNIDKMVNLGNSYMYLAKKWLDQKKNARAGLVLKKCQKHMEKALEKDPNRHDASLAIGIFNFYAAHVPPGLSFIAGLLGISGNEAKGLQYMQATANNPNLFQNDALFILAYSMANTKKNYAAARTYLNRLASKFPNNSQFTLFKGEYAMRGKQYAVAKGDFEQFFAFCGSHPALCSKNNKFLAHYYLGTTLVEMGNHAAGLKELEEAEKADQGRHADRSVRLHLLKGKAYKALGKNKQAEEEFKKVEAGQSKNSQAWKEAQEEMKK